MRSIGFATLLDKASTELLRMEEESRLPSAMRVHPDMYGVMADIRKREIADGFPLLVLGMPVRPDDSLEMHDYQLVD